MDRNAFTAGEQMEACSRAQELPEGAAALLIDTAAITGIHSMQQIRDIEQKLATRFPMLTLFRFTATPHFTAVTGTCAMDCSLPQCPHVRTYSLHH